MVGLIKLLFLSCRTYKQIYTFIEFINEICVNFYIGIEYYEFHIGIDQVLLVDIFIQDVTKIFQCMYYMHVNMHGHLYICMFVSR